MATLLYDTADTNDWDRDIAKTEIVGDQIRLKLQSATGTFNEDMTDATGWTTDTDRSEFAAGKFQSKSLTPSGLTFAANYNLGIDGNYGLGVMTATASGGAVVTSSKLDLSASGAYVNYPALNNASHQQVISYRFKWTPDFTGTSGDRKNLVLQDTGAGLVNSMNFKFETDGNFYLLVRDNVSGSIMAIATAHSPTSGVAIEIEINIDITTGSSYYYINGIKSAVATGTGTRDTITSFRIGDTSGTTGLIEDFEVYNTAIHTGASYTPGYTVEDYEYQETSAILPTFTHAGIGTILTYTGLTLVSEVGNLRYQIQTDSGNYKYWNGAAWANSDGTYAQSSTSAQMNTNLPALIDANGAETVTIKLFLPEGASVASIDNLVLGHTGHTGYPSSKELVKGIPDAKTVQILSLTATQTEPAGDNVNWIAYKGGMAHWWNGSAFAVSNETYAESSTLALLQANISTLSVDRADVTFGFFLSSGDQTTTPYVDGLQFSYTNTLTDPNTQTLVFLEGFIYDHDSPAAITEITVRPYVAGHNSGGVFHKYEYLTFDSTNADGYFNAYIYANKAGEQWEFKIGAQSYRVTIPDQTSVNWSDLTVTKVES